MKQYTLLTNSGINKLLKTASDGSKIALKEIVVSDYDGELSEQTTSIPNEKYRGAINAITIDESDSNILAVDAIIPPEVGGFYIKTAGIYCDDGSLFAVARLADTYKPLLNEGSSKDITLNFKLQIANASESIILKVDNNVVLATRKWSNSTFLKKTDAPSFIQTTQRTLVSQYAHIANSEVLPDGDYSSPDFWLSITPGIYYAIREKGRNKPSVYGLVEIISNGEVSVTWSYFGEVWKWYQGFDKSTLGWKKVVFGDVTHETRANSIVARDANGDFYARYIHAEYFRMTNPTQNDTFTADCDIVYRVNTNSNAYLRSAKISKVASLLGGLGVGQTWQDVLSQRQYNVVYTNTTNKPIFVSIVSYPTPTPTAYVSFYIDNLLVARSETSGINDNTQISAVIPSGSTYKMDNGGDNGTRLKVWTELR